MEIFTKPTLCNSFLLVYFYELERKLNQSENKLNEITFQSEEANTDEFLKKYFKEYILLNNNIKNTELLELKVFVDLEEFSIKISDIIEYEIRNVFLPNELTIEQKKEIAARKISIYTNPDLYLEITDGDNTFLESVELKSTKTNNIPGSSVQQVSPFEWVIFIKRTVTKVIVTTGYYLNSITNKLPFPDRSPRPQIGFNTLQEWNSKFRTVKNSNLVVVNNTDINADKINLLRDWQDFLATEWIETIETSDFKPNDKWFNNTLRIYSLKFIELLENKNQFQKEELKQKLISLIKK